MFIPLRRPLWVLLLVALALLAELTVTSSPALADPPPCADLVITGFTITPALTPPSQLVEGKNAKIEITVRNQGTCKSLSFVTQWKSDRLAPTGPSSYVEPLTANQSKKVTFEYAFPRAGNFTTVATVDTENTVDETNESNNLAIQDVTVLADLPDLVITSFTILPAQPVQGVDAKVNIRVKNQGSHAAGPFVVQWKSDRLAPTGPSTQISALAAAAFVDVKFDYAFPAAGDYTSVATVDTDLSVAEWNEDNNIQILAVNVQPARPDLVITDITILPVDPAPGFPNLPVAGLNAAIKITVLNQGNHAAGPFVVQWKSDLAAPTGPTGHVDFLAAGAKVVVSFQYAFPRAGNFTTAATVDSDNTVAESNESNNLAIAHTVVQEAVIDLVLTVFKVEPAPGVPASVPPLPVQGRLTRATIAMENRGNYPAGDFTVEWNPTLLSPGLSTQVNGLKYGKSKTVTFDYTYPTAGTFQTRAMIDSTSRIRETDETNNSETKAVVVEPQRPDLTITKFMIVPASPVAGTKAATSITVWNRGNTPAGPFVVQWKPTPLASALSMQVNSLAVGAKTTVSFDYTYLFPGTFSTTATVDSLSRVVELDETNNTNTMSVIVQRATRDLVITGFRIVQGGCGETAMADLVEPGVPQGSPIHACITVQNLGNSPIGPFVVSWNPDALGLIVPSPATKTHQVDTLGAGQETLVVFEFVYTQAGNFRTVAEVDAFHTVAETNESNNLEILNVVVVATGPDLVILEMVIEPAVQGDQAVPGRTTCLRPSGELSALPSAVDLEEPRLVQGERNRICIKVGNQGNRNAGPFVVEWNPDALGLATPSLSTVSTQVEGLTPGAFTLVEFSFIYDKPGTYRTIAKADAFNNVHELLEGNNEKIVNVIVDPVGPDLKVTKLTVSAGNVSCTSQAPGMAVIEPKLKQGEVATVCIQVTNQGNRAAVPFVVEWNPDSLGLITPSPGTLSKQVDGLAASASTMIKFNFTYHQHGQFRTVANADAFNNVAELDEANNLAIFNVIVDPANIDLKITAFTVKPAQGTDIIRGSKAVASVTVKNLGTYPTGAFSVQWRPTGEDSSGPYARVDGLQPSGQAGDSITVQLEGVFYIAGPYESFAIADVFNEVIETDESKASNTKTTHVDVKPRVTTLKVTINSLTALNALKQDWDFFCTTNSYGRWYAAFAVGDSTATCHLGDQDITGFRCTVDSDYRRVDNNGQVLSINQSYQTTLVESAPLLLAGGAVALTSGATLIGCYPDGANFAGFTLQVWSAADYRGVGTTTVAGEQGVGNCGGGHCFDLKYTVTVLSEPPPLASGAQELAPESVVMPAGVLELLHIPADAVLPDGVTRRQYQFLPAIDK